MAFLAAAGAITVTIAGAVLWRAGHGVSLRDLGMVARATGSPRACLGYLRFCARSVTFDPRR